mmetsp:Transcript_33341/g.62184  ORF Transcript_33341/g.62184 Transcript_33341/m.62184 type:complete len:554 (-) Transcript_33341:661-2322(-)
MSTLEERIRDVEAEIVKLTARLDKAVADGNEGKEKTYANLITASRNNLTTLLQQQQQQQQAQTGGGNQLQEGGGAGGGGGPIELSRATISMLGREFANNLLVTRTSPSPSHTPAYQGFMLVEEAKRAGVLRDFRECTEIDGSYDIIIPTGSVPPNDCAECVLNCLLYQFLSPICAEYGLDLVNSESIAWVQVDDKRRKFDQKPDFFACRPAFYDRRDAYSSDNHELLSKARRDLVGEGMKYGKPHWQVRDGIGVTFKTKSKYKNEGVAELYTYLVSMADLRGSALKGIFMWNSGFMLMTVLGGEIQTLDRAEWNTPGSKQLFEKFLQLHIPPWVQVLDMMCRQRSLQLVSHGFLGRGAKGRVFIVHEEDRVEVKYALKIVIMTEDSADLEIEFSSITECALHNHDLPVVRPVTGSFINGSYELSNRQLIDAASYMMMTVGSPAPWGTKSEKLAILESLRQLHQARVCHGDARRQNVIVDAKGKLLWVDFMSCHRIAQPGQIKRDVTVLLESLCQLSVDSFPNGFQEISTEYAHHPTDANMRTLFQLFDNMTIV